MCAEAPKSSEHPNARGAAEGDSGFPWHGAGRCCSELLLNSSPLALRYVVCAEGVLAGWELPAQLAGEGSWVWQHRWNCGFGSGFGSGLLVWIVVEGRGLTALQPEVPVFGLEIVALCNFSTKLPVSQIWA